MLVPGGRDERQVFVVIGRILPFSLSAFYHVQQGQFRKQQ